MNEEQKGIDGVNKEKLSEPIKRLMETEDIKNQDQLHAYLDSLRSRYTPEEFLGIKDAVQALLRHERQRIYDAYSGPKPIKSSDPEKPFFHLPVEIRRALFRILTNEKQDNEKQDDEDVAVTKTEPAPEKKITEKQIETSADILKYLEQEYTAGKTTLKDFAAPITEIRKEVVLAANRLPYDRTKIPDAFFTILEKELTPTSKASKDSRRKKVSSLTKPTREATNHAIENAKNEIDLRVALIDLLTSQGMIGKHSQVFLDKIDRVFENPTELENLFPQSTTEPTLYAALKRLTSQDKK